MFIIITSCKNGKSALMRLWWLCESIASRGCEICAREPTSVRSKHVCGVRTPENAREIRPPATKKGAAPPEAAGGSFPLSPVAIRRVQLEARRAEIIGAPHSCPPLLLAQSISSISPAAKETCQRLLESQRVRTFSEFDVKR